MYAFLDAYYNRCTYHESRITLKIVILCYTVYFKTGAL